jgi:hypothetical protein
MNSFAEIKGLAVGDIAKSAFSDRPDLHVRAEGEFLGRRSFRGDASRPTIARSGSGFRTMARSLAPAGSRKSTSVIREGRSLTFLRGMLNSVS